MIVVKIDWNKIDVERLYRGEKTDYLNIVLKDNRDGTDQYGNDGFVIQDQTKEEREAKVRAPIIGNWRHLGQKPAARGQERPDDRQPQRRRPEPPQRRERPLPTRPAPGTHGRRQEPEKRSYNHDDPDADPNF